MRFLSKILLLISFVLILIYSCEKRFRLLESKKQKVENLNLKVENLIGDLTILPDKKYLYEIKKVSLLGEIITNTEKSSFTLSLRSFSGETKLFINKNKKLYIDANVTGGNLKVYSQKLNLEKFWCELNGGGLEFEAGDTLKMLAISNNLGDVKIKINKNIPVKLKLSSMASMLSLPEEFVFSNDYFYYLNQETNFLEINIYVNMGSLEIFF